MAKERLLQARHIIHENLAEECVPHRWDGREESMGVSLLVGKTEGDMVREVLGDKTAAGR